MGPSVFEGRVAIAAEPRQVHAFLADLENLRALHPLIERIRALPPRSEHSHARRWEVVDRIPIGPFHMRTRYVAELEVLSESEVQGRAWQFPAVELHTNYRVEAAAGGTLLVERAEVWAPFPLLGFVVRQAEAAHEATRANLKSHLEARPAST